MTTKLPLLYVSFLEEENYLCDPHTAVAVNVYRQYLQETGDTAPTIIASTCKPL